MVWILKLHFYTLFGGYIGVSLSVDPSVHLSLRRSVCSFLSALFLINYWTNFIQTSQVHSVSSRDVHMKYWLWFIDFSLSYGPFSHLFCIPVTLKSNFSVNRFFYISNIIWIQFQNWKPYFNVLCKKGVISINVVCKPVRVCKIFDKPDVT